MVKVFRCISYACPNFMRATKKSESFDLHKNQVFNDYKTCKSCLFESSKNGINDNGGVVYQVETGEGKSCIVCLIASLLALMKKTVSIASSNIALSNRDYYESYEFFKRIHYNELPFSNNYFQLEIMMTFIQENFTQKKSLFANASNNNEISKDKADIAFSTFVNFESLYLRIMEMYPVYIKEYFQKCSLVIDRVDSILVVELTNGTIVPRSLKTNGE